MTQGTTRQAQQSVLAWLKDAHAMEAGGVVTLTNHAEAAGDYPELQAKLREHAETTRRHAELVEGCIERLGGHPSSLKEAVGAAVSKVAGVANLPAQDTVIKNALGDLAAENFEIASYVSLIAAAEHTGDDQTASVCRQILADERELAAFLEAQIPVATRQFLARTTGEGGGLLEQAKQTVQNLGEQVKAAAPDAGDTRNALLVSGALLAGAGAALLVGQALLGGSERDRDSDDADVPQYPTQYPTQDPAQDASAGTEAAADAGAYAATSETPTETSDDVPGGVSSLSDDLGEGTGEGTGSSEGLLEAAPALRDPLDETVMPEETEVVGTLEVSGQDEIVIETLSEDARFLLASEPAAAPVAEDSGETTGALPASPSDEPQAAAATPEAETEAGIWLVPGPYSGLGPSSYDAADPLGQDVYARLAQHGHVDATHIEIVIDGGEVLLGGSVDSETTKRLAEEAVRNVAGVEQVQNLLQVRDSLN